MDSKKYKELLEMTEYRFKVARQTYERRFPPDPVIDTVLDEVECNLGILVRGFSTVVKIKEK